MRFVTSSFGITMYAGPASVMPYEFETVASGSRSWSASSVRGASGALPMDTAQAREVGLGEAGRGDEQLGHRGHEERHRRPLALDDLEPPAASNFGRYIPCRPIFIGL